MQTSWWLQPNATIESEPWPAFYGSLTFVEFLRLGQFLRNYNGQIHETWAMHTSWRVKINSMFNFEYWPTVYGSLTFCRVFAFRSFSQKLWGLETWNFGHAYILKSKGQSYAQSLVLTYLLWLTDFCRVFTFRSFSQKLLELEPWNLGHAYILKSKG